MSEEPVEAARILGVVDEADDDAVEADEDERRERRRERAEAREAEEQTDVDAESESAEVQEPAEVVEPPAEEPAPAPARATNTLDALLDRAVVREADEPAPQSESEDRASSEPSGPSRAQVAAAMEGIRPALLACAEGQHGLSHVQVTVGPSGRVRSVRVLGAFAGTPQGSCMARASRAASFYPFEGEPMTFRYPYRF